MKLPLNELIIKWKSLNKREQRAMYCLSLFLFIIFYYFVLYSPLKQAIEHHQQALQIQYDQRSWLKKIKPFIPSIHRPTTASRSIDVFMETLSTDLKKSPLKSFPFHLEQTNETDLQLSFEKVPYLLLIEWFYTYCTHYPLHIRYFSAQPTKTSGTIKLQLIVQNP